MLNKIWDFGNILRNKNTEFKEKSQKYFSDFKSYVTAILLGSSVSLGACTTLEKPKNEEFREVLVVPDFGYKELKRDKDGYIMARTGLKDADEVEDGFSSIEELFTKLNSMTKTQVEPGFKPYYYAEYDEETGEKIPTFILVGEYHSEDRLTSRKFYEFLKNGFGKSSLVEEDESYLQGADAIEIISKKFGIKNIGLEGEHGTDKFIYDTALGNELLRRGIKTIPLDNKETNDMVAAYRELKDIYKLSIFESLGFNMNPKFDKHEIEVINTLNQLKYMTNDAGIFLFNDAKISDLYYDSIFFQTHIDWVESLFEGREVHDILYELEETGDYENTKLKLKKVFEKSLSELKEPFNKDYIELYLKYRITNELLFGHPYLEYRKVNEISFGYPHYKKLNDNPYLNGHTTEELFDKFIENLIYENEFNIVTRNKIGINVITKNFDDQKIGVMLWGKDHMKDLEKKLKEKYNGKVNIYVAK